MYRWRTVPLGDALLSGGWLDNILLGAAALLEGVLLSGGQFDLNCWGQQAASRSLGRYSRPDIVETTLNMSNCCQVAGGCARGVASKRVIVC